MSLDISTLYLVAMFVAALLGVMLLYFWRQEKIAALGWWGTAYLMGALSLGVWALAGTSIPPVAMAVVNLIGFVACGLVWNAARVFHGRPPGWIGLSAGAAIWLAAVMIAEPTDTRTLVLVGSSIVAAYAALTAHELWSERRKALRSRWVSLFIPLLHGLVLMMPIVVGDVISTSSDPLNVKNGWVAAFAVELVLYAVGTVFILFMLVSERNVAIHRAAAAIDPLTGLFNRRGFAEATARIIDREQKAGRPVSVLLFDIDHFKSINDRFGHPVGDEVLKLFAQVVSSSLRMTDLMGRIGGEEFAALLPCSVEEAMRVADRVRENFATSGIAVDDAPIDTTVSIGVAGGPAGIALEVLLASADTALYQAKRGGRNCVRAASEEPLSLDESRLRSAAQRGPERKVNMARPLNDLEELRA